MFSVSTVLGENAFVVEQSWGASAKLPSLRPAPHWTGRAQVKERIMFSKLRILLFVCFRSTHGWMGMDVRVNVFTMPFLCSDSGPWRKMSRAWPPMSAITTSSGSTSPSHQESAWGAAEARQERIFVEVVRKAVFSGFFKFICWTHLQMFSVSTVLGEKYSVMQQSRGESTKLPGLRPAPHWTGRAQVKERIMFSKLRILLFVYFRSTHGWMGMDVWVNVFTMPCLCADSGPWRKMSRAWPPMSAITTSSDSTCPSHQESAWGAAEARQERVIVEVVRKAVIAGFFKFICWKHLQMFSVSTVLGEKTSVVEQSWGESVKFTGGRLPPRLDRKGTTNHRRHVWWVECLALC